MNLELRRGLAVDGALPGELFVNGDRYSFTLENARQAIPAGRYDVIVNYSDRAFHGELWTPDGKTFTLPLLLNVPGRSGIRIHCANAAFQLEGCIAVGATWSGASLGSSQRTFSPLFALLLGARARLEAVSIDVLDPPKTQTVNV